MKVTAKNRNYQFSPIFKISSVIILILSAVGIAGSIALFMFGMAWVFMGAYQNETVNEKHITWGIVMICLGGYLILVNAFALTADAIAVNKRSARWTLLISIVSILGIVPIIGGIVMLFTPIDVKTTSNNGNKTDSSTNSSSKTTNSKKNNSANNNSQENNLVVRKFATSEEDRESMASELRDLKTKIDKHTASETEKEKFEILLADYREKYPKTGQE